MWSVLSVFLCVAVSLPKPEHLVVMMLENQSFDRIFGWSPELGGTLTPNTYYNEDNQGNKIYITSGQDPHTGNAYDPCHTTPCMLDQMYGPGGYLPPGGSPTGSGYIKTMGQTSPGEEESYFRFFDAESSLPNLYALAKRYVVMSQWHASLPGATGPNRLFAACSSTGGYAGAAYTPGAYPEPVPLPSIYQLLAENGHTWHYYENDRLPQGLGTQRALKVLQDNPNNISSIAQFLDDASRGRLAKYSWIVPDLVEGAQDSLHPGTADGSMIPGDTLLGKVYQALESNITQFSKTVFLVVFDEAGGFWDSKLPQGFVSPPEYNGPTNWWPSDGEKNQFDFKTRGPRVPALLIHPHLQHRVDTSVYEHSSIPRTVRELFVPKASPLSVREKESGNFLKNNGFDIEGYCTE